MERLSHDTLSILHEYTLFEEVDFQSHEDRPAIVCAINTYRKVIFFLYWDAAAFASKTLRLTERARRFRALSIGFPSLAWGS